MTPSSREPRPDFIIIGAMKSATSTLHAQLAGQPGVFMSRLKEPNFFSDDEQFAKGIDWYREQFADASVDDLRGESSTHYTKAPTHPHTVERLAQAYPDVKLIYVMRNPVDRLISHYIHEWTERRMSGPLDDCLARHPELIDYGRYAMQLSHYWRSFPRERILPIFFDRLRLAPQEELNRVGRFLGLSDGLVWRSDVERQNVSRDRLRKSGFRDALKKIPGLRPLLRSVLPKSVMERAKGVWRMSERPTLSESSLALARAAFDRDLATLGDWLGVALNLEDFSKVTAAAPLEWQSEAVASAGSSAEVAS